MSDVDLDEYLDDEFSDSGQSPDKSLGREIATDPLLQTLFLMAVISFIGWAIGGVRTPYHPHFALRPPVDDPWYSAVLATYAHFNTTHLMGNAILIAICGGLISFGGTSQIRFHLFFLTTGVLSAVGFVVIQRMTGTPIGVIGSSGAGFALLGYVMVANPISLPVVRALGTRAVILVSGIISIYVALRLTPEGAALLGHFLGLIMGMAAGRFRLLRSR